MATRVEIDRAAITKFFSTDPVPQAALLGVAEGLKGVAEEASPFGRSLSFWGRGPGRHGNFKRSWQVRKFRGGYRVINTDPFGHLVEYGSSKNPAYAPARRALRSVAGGRAIVYSRGQHISRVGGEFGPGGRGT